MAKKQVTKIPPSPKKNGTAGTVRTGKRRVAAYARVSTEMEEQLGSYESQIRYYEDLIRSHADWEFAGMYADQGISGTQAETRPGFTRMIDDALAGKIDLILTKSVSRFARNTVDSISNIRKLKNNGTEVFFEKENIWTFDTKGELLLTIMSSLAQEESRSISENTRMGINMRASEGKYSVPYSRFLGYDKDPEGGIKVNPEQAKIVRTIFTRFLEGESCAAIASSFTSQGVKTPTGKDVWCSSSVKNILRNEKYTGCAMILKYHTTDFLTHRSEENAGQWQRFFVPEEHEAIISYEEFEKAQVQLLVNDKKSKYYHRRGLKNCFSGKLKCGCCGALYGPVQTNPGKPNSRTVYRCNQKYMLTTNTGETKKRCDALNPETKDLQEIYMKAWKQLTTRGNADIIKAIEKAKDMSDLDTMLASYDAESHPIDYERYELLAEAKLRRQQVEELESLLKKIAVEKTSNIFDEEAFRMYCDHITVYSDRYTVCFIGGMEESVFF